jgi:hypothetical protein
VYNHSGFEDVRIFLLKEWILQSSPTKDLLAALAQVPDPRGRKGRCHCISAMLTAVVCAVLSGARGYRAIVQWLHLQDAATWHWMGFT